jgi:DNA-binding MarR family transcriptional regulator
MPELPIDSQTPELETYRLLLRLHKLLAELNRREFRPYDLSTPQYAVLVHASEAGVPLGEISDRMLADNSNLTRMVDRLEARGLVRRAPDPRDRRVTLVQLTPEGAALASELRPRHRALIGERMRHATPDQLAAMHTAMEMIYNGLLAELKEEPHVNGPASRG